MRFLQLLLVLAGATILAGGSLAVPAAAPDSASVLVRVNGTDISRAKFLRYLTERGGKAALEALTNRILIRQEAERLGARVTDRDVSDRRALVQKRLGGRRSYQQLLDRLGVSDKLYREQIRYSLLAERTAARRYPPRESEFVGLTVRVIVARNEQQAQAFIRELDRSRGQSFPALAERFSLDRQTGKRGGLYTTRPLLRVDDPKMYQAVEKLRDGQYLKDPVTFGEDKKILVLMLEKRHPPSDLTPEQRAAALSRLTAPKVPEMLADLRKTARLQELNPLVAVASNQPPLPNDAVVRRVNGEAITRAQLLERELVYDGEKALSQLVNLALLNWAAARKKVTVDESALAKAFQRAQDRAGGPRRFAKSLQDAGLTEEQIKENLRADLLTMAVAKKKWPVKNSDLVRLQFRYIRTDNRDKARRIIKTLRLKASFDVLARRPSVSLDAQATGGYVGDGKPIFRIDSPALFKTIIRLGLRPGKFNLEPVRSGKYYLIFRLEKRLLPDSLSPAARRKAVARIEAYRASRLLDTLRVRADIRYFGTVRGLIDEFKPA